MTNKLSPAQELDQILQRLLADVDDSMEFLGSVFNPKNRATIKVKRSLDKAKTAIKRHEADAVRDARIDELESTLRVIKDSVSGAVYRDLSERIIFLKGGSDA